MKKVLAISGGVDSMVLLDMYRKKYDADELVVAHFDHGTRESAKTDYDFVKKKCAELSLKFVGACGELGEGVPEHVARAARYDFLFREIKKYDAKLVTAHHLDDLVESVAINLTRGTGWRGLAVLNTLLIERPLLKMTRAEILKYAAENKIMFREDPTNSSENYLRNRLRPGVRFLDAGVRRRIGELRDVQVKIVAEIDKILGDMLTTRVYEREWFRKMDDEVAMEILRFITLRAECPATRPQLKKFLSAIREYEPGKYFNLPNDKLVRLNKNDFKL